jgi:hypothetical protein
LADRECIEQVEKAEQSRNVFTFKGCNPVFRVLVKRANDLGLSKNESVKAA